MIFPDKNFSMKIIENSILEDKAANLKARMRQREDLGNFYAGAQDHPNYLKNWGFKTKDQLPLQTINIFKKVIDKRSLVYKTPPDRYFETNDEVYTEWINENPKFNFWMSEAERYKNALGIVLKRPIYLKDIGWRFFVDTEFIPHFSEYDPYTPIAYSIPIKRDTVSTSRGKQDLDWWMFWSDKYYFWYVPESGEKRFTDFAPTGEHGLGIMPIVESRTNFPIDDYWVDGAVDLMQSNQSININLNNLNYALHFQAFNYLWSSGVDAKDADNIKVSTDRVTTFSDPEMTLNVLDLNPKITEMIDAIKFEFEAISNNYHVNVQWGSEGDPSSGFALMVKNIDLLEARIDDVKLCELEEKEIYKVIQIQQDKYKMKEPKLPRNDKLIIDFSPVDFPINQREQIELIEWKLSRNQTNELDILQTEEGLDETAAMERWERNKQINKKLSPAQEAFANELSKIGQEEQPEEEDENPII